MTDLEHNEHSNTAAAPTAPSDPLAFDGILSLAQYFGVLTSFVPPSFDLRTPLQSEGLVSIVIGLLQTLARLDDRHNATSTAEHGSEEYRAARFTSTSTYGLKRELIRIVGNMAYRHRATQDEVRSLGGLVVVLGHCNLDDNNPCMDRYCCALLMSTDTARRV